MILHSVLPIHVFNRPMPWREHLPHLVRIYIDSALTSRLQWNRRLNKMALVVNPSHMYQKIWREEEPEDLINVFLKMWDGKVRSLQPGRSDRWRGPSVVDDSSLCSSHVVLLLPDAVLFDQS